MKNRIRFREIEANRGFWALLALMGTLIGLAALAFFYLKIYGHVATGMNNQIVWGLPHVFAILMIVAASGALNVASIGSVFGRKVYKPLAPLSGLLAVTLLIGGLAVLVLDLGRPDRLIIAMTHYNFKSIFAWNIILYNGFLVIVALYLWTLMERRMNRYSKPVGLAAFLWRLILTTGTGSIFGFLVARDAYDAAILAPMFILMSFSIGLAVYLLTLMAAASGNNRPIGHHIMNRLKNLLGIFIAGVLYFVVVFHVTNLYSEQNAVASRFILAGGTEHTTIFWLVYVVIGSLLPLAILFAPQTAGNPRAIGLASVLTVIGGAGLLYVIIIGGQALPLQLFPGMEVSSSFADGQVNAYTPSLPEILLGVGGVALFVAMTAVAMAVLRFLPESLADDKLDPHYSAESTQEEAAAKA